MKIQFPDKLSFLFEPARYKVAYGGRGGAKSWGFADALLIIGASRTIRVLCCREIQKSMKESVHQLLQDRIKALGLSHFYEPLNDEIRGQNGTLFLFAGLRHNVDNIKSKEGIDIVWIEEARNVLRSSLDKLIPTIRKDGSEIWMSFNPELETDPVYQDFVLNQPPEFIDGKRYAFVEKVGWQDNPWFPEELRKEAQRLRERSEDDYLHIYGGHCKVAIDGAILANELRAATSEGRITRVPHVRGTPVNTAWDLGKRDLTSIWFWQRVGLEYRFIDFYQARGHHFSHYLAVLQQRSMEKGYVYDHLYLPHDGDSGNIAAEKTAKRQAEDAGHRAKVMPRVQKKATGINMIRDIFPRCVFDEKNTSDGLNCLRRWQYEVEDGQWSNEPLHNDESHAADAFQTFAQAMVENPKVTRPKLNLNPDISSGAQGWMR